LIIYKKNNNDMNVLNFKNRIRELRDNITDDNIKNLCNKYVVNFDNSQKNVNLIREVLLNSINDYLPNLTNKNDIDKKVMIKINNLIINS